MKENSWDIDHMEWMFFKNPSEKCWDGLAERFLYFASNPGETESEMNLRGRGFHALDTWLQDWMVAACPSGFAIATRSPERECLEHLGSTRGKLCWFEEPLAEDALTPSRNLTIALRAVEWLSKGEIIGSGVWLCFFAALCKEDLNYSQPMNQFARTCPLLN